MWIKAEKPVMSSTASYLFAFHWLMHWAFLFLVEGERCFLFWAWLVTFPVLCTTVRSPYNRDKLAYKTLFKDGSVSFSASFDPDDPTLIDRYPDYTTETDPGERPPTPTQQRVSCLPVKLRIVWVDRSLTCVNIVGLWRACSSLCVSVWVLSSVIGILSSVCVSTQVLMSSTASYLFAFHWLMRWAFLFLVTSGYISTVNWNLQIYLTMDLPVELVGLLKHAGIDGKN
jgi:hypothetical protein